MIDKLPTSTGDSRISEPSTVWFMLQVYRNIYVVWQLLGIYAWVVQKKCWLEDITKSSISNKEKLARGSLRGSIMEASEP